MASMTNTTAGQETRPSNRADWIDIAKAMSILLILVGHGMGTLDAIEQDASLVEGFVMMLTPVRIPMFFLVSGIFAAKLFESRREKFIERVADLAKVYVLWSVITYAWRMILFPEYSPELTSIGVSGILDELLLPTPFPWFIWALVVFNILGYVGTRTAPKTTLALAAFSAFAGYYIPVYLPGTHTVAGVGFYRNFLFFILPFYLPHIRQWAERRSTIPTASLAGIVYCLLLAAGEVAGDGFLGSLAMVTASLIGIISLLMIARMLEASPLRRPLTKVGQKTLPIYLMHVIFMMGLALLLEEAGVYTGPFANLLIIVGITIVSAVASMKAEEIMPKPMRAFLFIEKRESKEAKTSPVMQTL